MIKLHCNVLAVLHLHVVQISASVYAHEARLKLTRIVRIGLKSRSHFARTVHCLRPKARKIFLKQTKQNKTKAPNRKPFANLFVAVFVMSLALKMSERTPIACHVSFMDQ